MNFQYTHPSIPVRVLMVNPLVPAAQLITIKILSGTIFGEHQLVDLILLVYSNEKPVAEALKIELDACAFDCTNSIEVSSDLPTISDADVFCFITNFSNPNTFNFEKTDIDEHFDTLYLIIKIANNFSTITPSIENLAEDKIILSKKKEPEIKPRKPILMADGLIAIDILSSLSKNLPVDCFFCPTPLSVIAKSVLGDYLKVQCNELNEVFVWAANDEVFHIEISKPFIVHDKIDTMESDCNWDMVGKDNLSSFNLDHTQFSPSWLKKEFIEKVQTRALKNPHGCIYKAAEFSRTLHALWSYASAFDAKKSYGNMGVISDGSLGTVKGCPYVLPLVFDGDTWTVNRAFEEDTHLKQEIKRINRAVKEHHLKLIPYCKKFLEYNVIQQKFILSQSTTTLSSSEGAIIATTPSRDFQ